VKFYHFGPRHGDEENIFEIPPCPKPFLENIFYFKKGGFLHKTTNSEPKMTLFAHRGISKKNCGGFK
jgi:hypothetical protein